MENSFKKAMSQGEKSGNVQEERISTSEIKNRGDGGDIHEVKQSSARGVKCHNGNCKEFVCENGVCREHVMQNEDEENH